MKLMFLDINGVLATEASASTDLYEEFSYRFDAECVAIFNEILTESQSKLY